MDETIFVLDDAEVVDGANMLLIIFVILRMAGSSVLKFSSSFMPLMILFSDIIH
jgi:hypothetical protein